MPANQDKVEVEVSSDSVVEMVETQQQEDIEVEENFETPLKEEVEEEE